MVPFDPTFVRNNHWPDWTARPWQTFATISKYLANAQDKQRAWFRTWTGFLGLNDLWLFVMTDDSDHTMRWYDEIWVIYLLPHFWFEPRRRPSVSARLLILDITTPQKGGRNQKCMRAIHHGAWFLIAIATSFRFLFCAVLNFRPKERAQRLTFCVWRPPGGVGSSTRRGGGRKVRALPRKFVFLGFRGEKLGMSRDFCRDIPDPWRCSKSLCKKSSCAFFVPYNLLGWCLVVFDWSVAGIC